MSTDDFYRVDETDVDDDVHDDTPEKNESLEEMQRSNARLLDPVASLRRCGICNGDSHRTKEHECSNCHEMGDHRGIRCPWIASLDKLSIG